MKKTQINEETLSVSYRNKMVDIDKKSEAAISGRSYTLLLDKVWELDEVYQAVTGTELEWKNYYVLMDDGKVLPISLPVKGVKLVNRVQRARGFGKPRMKYGYEGCWVSPERLLFNITMLTMLGYIHRREDYVKKHYGTTSRPKSWEIHESYSRLEPEYLPR